MSEQALIAYEHSVQTAFGEAENAVTGYATDRSRLADLEAAEASASAAFKAEQIKYAAGYTDQTSLLQKEHVWRQSRAALISLQITALTDAITAFKALGGGWTPDSNMSAS